MWKLEPSMNSCGHHGDLFHIFNLPHYHLVTWLRNHKNFLLGLHTHVGASARHMALCHADSVSAAPASFTSAQGDSLSREELKQNQRTSCHSRQSFHHSFPFYFGLANAYNVLRYNKSGMEHFCLILKDTVGTERKP